MSIPSLERLGLTQDADERAIRRAYARELKQIDQEADPEGFQSLREAYDHALMWLRHQAWEDEDEVQQEAEVHQATHETLPIEAERKEDDPAALAEAVFVEFRQRCESIPSEPADRPEDPWMRELRQSLDDPRLIGIAARDAFEHCVAYLLAEGWQPGHEALLVAATHIFNWRDDRRRVLCLGHAGHVIDEAMSEREIFDKEPTKVWEEQRRLIARLRDPSPPGTQELVVNGPLVELLISRYPNWLALVSSVPNIRHWRQMNAKIPRWRRKLTFAGIRRSFTKTHEKQVLSGWPMGSWVWMFISILVFITRLASCNGHSDVKSVPSVESYISQAGKQVDNNDLQGAIETFDKAIALAPNNAEAISYRGLAHALKGDLELAQADVDHAAKLSISQPMVYRARGVLEFQRKHYDKAIEAFTKCLQYDPAHIYTLMQRAYAFADKGDAEKALADADNVLKQTNGDHLDAHLLRLYILARQEQSDKTIDEFNAVIKAYPTEPMVYSDVAYGYASWKRTKDALAVLDQGILAAPDARLYLLRGLLRPAEDIVGRRSDFSDALSKDPASVGAAYSLAELEFKQHHLQAALAVLEKALSQPGIADNARIELISTRAIMYDQSGKHAEANQDIDTARKMMKTPMELNNLCWRLGQHNAALSAALDLCNASLAGAPNEAATLDSKGLILLRMGKYREAVAIYDQAIAARETMSSSWMGRAIAKHHLGDAAGSKADAAQARKLKSSVDQVYADMGLKLPPA